MMPIGIHKFTLTAMKLLTAVAFVMSVTLSGLSYYENRPVNPSCDEVLSEIFLFNLCLKNRPDCFVSSEQFIRLFELKDIEETRCRVSGDDGLQS